MASQPSRTMRGRVLAVLLVAGLLASACTSKASHTSPSSGRVNSAPAPFEQAVVDTFIHDLAAAGIGTFRLGSAAPMVPVTAATGVHLTDEQAANAALGAHGHSGLSGADIDSIVAPDPLAAGAQSLPARTADRRLGADEEVTPGTAGQAPARQPGLEQVSGRRLPDRGAQPVHRRPHQPGALSDTAH